MLFNKAEYNLIKARYYDPANPVTQVYYKNPNSCVRLHFAIVDDNKDPDGYGRLKLFFPQWGDNVISHWVPFARPYAGSGGGFWALPEVGDQVVCTFINDNPAKPVVIGCLYTPRAKPPISDNQDNNLKVLTTKSGSKIILDDTDGSERILIHTKDGEMRLVLDKANGLQIVNDKGDINIKCRKLTVEAGDAANIKFNKECSITCDQEKLTLESKKGMELKSGKDAVLSGSKIKIKGNSGVTAGVKQIAKKDDQVIGVDMHDIQVPSSSGLVTVPMIPHPYVGKLADKLSDDVTINDKAAAMKGSKSKYSTPGHIAMPPGVKFAKNPNNEGEVSSGTEPSVKINGKEAAVLGSMVKTCNDPQPQETCTIVAMGVSVPLPIMIPGMDAEQFEKDGGLIVNTREPIAPAGKPLPQDIQRSLNNLKWSAGKAKVGEEVTLSVSLTNQYENANVFFTIWEEGTDRDKDAPVKKLSAPNKGGQSEVKWRYCIDDFEFEKPSNPLVSYFKDRLRIDFIPRSAEYLIEDYETPYTNPLKKTARFIFTVKSYRCEEAESQSIEIAENIAIQFNDASGRPLKDVEYSIIHPDGSRTEGKTSDDGKVEKQGMIPGQHQIHYIKKSDSKSGSASGSSGAAARAKSPNSGKAEIKNPKWTKGGKVISKASVGETVLLTADVNGVNDGEQARILIYEKDYDNDNDFITAYTVKVRDSQISLEWPFEYHEDTDDVDSREEQQKTGYTKPEYIFIAEVPARNIKSNASKSLEMQGWIQCLLVNKKTGLPLKNRKYTLLLPDGSKKEGCTDEEGFIREKELIYGQYRVVLKAKDEDKKRGR